jgi:hypothetical protein
MSLMCLQGDQLIIVKESKLLIFDSPVFGPRSKERLDYLNLCADEICLGGMVCIANGTFDKRYHLIAQRRDVETFWVRFGKFLGQTFRYFAIGRHQHTGHKKVLFRFVHLKWPFKKNHLKGWQS